MQVKRRRGKIKAEQIRAFLGALVLSGYTNGVFIATSHYQKGAKASANLAKDRGVSVELLDADGFFDLLKIAQIKDFNKGDFDLSELVPVENLKIELSFGNHMNSL